MSRACLALFVLLAASHARAESLENTVSLDPVSGTVGFTGRNLGEWRLGYERRFGEHHGLVIEQATVHVHKPPFHLTVMGVGAGYRYHFRPAERRSSPFVGVLAGGKLGFGRFGDMDDNDLSAHAVFVTAHAGWRWVFARGFTVTLRAGAGYAHYGLGGSTAGAAEAQMDDRLKPLPFEVDSELGIGLSF
jgi:hypothetical protein